MFRRATAAAFLICAALSVAYAAVTVPAVTGRTGTPEAATAVVVVDTNGDAVNSVLGQLPSGAVQLTAASGNVANATAAATLAASATKKTYIAGFQCTPGGSTGAALVVVTVVGVVTGTMSYVVGTPAGATLIGTPLNVQFNPPVPSSAINTAVVVSMPALGAGNTNAACAAQGFQL